MGSTARIVGKTMSLGWRIIIFLASFGIVLFVTWELKLWSGDFIRYFILAGKWEMLVFMLLVTTAVSMVLHRLLQWQFMIETQPIERRRAK